MQPIFEFTQCRKLKKLVSFIPPTSPKLQILYYYSIIVVGAVTSILRVFFFCKKMLDIGINITLNGKSVGQVPDTDTQVLDNTRHFFILILFASGCYQHILKDVNITFSGNTGTPAMFQYSPILGRSSIWDLKYTFSN